MAKKKPKKMDRESVIAEHFADLDKNTRPASIAQLTAAEQSSPTDSCFGGVFAGRKDSTWPSVNGHEMQGILQIRTKDLPYRTAPLEDIALLQLFCLCQKEQDDFPAMPVFDADDWYHIRTYPNLRGLRPLERTTESLINPCVIEWSKVETEIPSYPDNLEWLDDEKREQFRELDDWAELLRASYSSHAGTKVGGWPTSCQNGLNRNGYAVQVGSEELANFMWGDNGVAVLFQTRDKWTLDWDCY